jgi:Cu+-exporting ATPase
VKIEHGIRDPVCGMVVDPHTVNHRHRHDGLTYYFCSGGCLARFVADPKKYVEKAPSVPIGVPEGTIYTCPMHPQIRQVGSGSCPICGWHWSPWSRRPNLGQIANWSR